MTGLPVVISDQAELDITESFNWYRERSADAADAFGREVVEGIERIARTPFTWKEDDQGNRRIVLRRFPFSVVYEVTHEAVIVMAVAHHRKLPRYWANKP